MIKKKDLMVKQINRLIKKTLFATIVFGIGGLIGYGLLLLTSLLW